MSTLRKEPYRVSGHRVTDIVDASTVKTLTNISAPAWLQTVEDRPAVPDLMVFANGIFDLAYFIDTGEVKMYPPDPRLFVTYCFPYVLDMNARSEAWEYVGGSTFGDDPDKAQLAHEWLGYMCVVDLSAEKFVLLHGDTRSGKGIFISAAQAMLGTGQFVAASFNSLGGDHAMANFVNKLAVFMGDAKEPTQIRESPALQRLLEVVGRDFVNINPKHKDEITRSLYCRFTLAVNHLPYLKNSARAIESRAIILDFANSFWGKEDLTLKDRIIKDASDRIIKDASEGKLIPYALRGLRDLRANKNIFTLPKSSVKRLIEFGHIMSPALQFVEDCCVLERSNKEYTVTSSELYEAWVYWCKEHGNSAGTNSTFGKNLRSAVPFLRDQRNKKMIDGRVYTYFHGMRLQDWVKSAYFS